MTGRLKLLATVVPAGIAAAMWGASAGSSAAYGPVYGPPCAAGPCSPAPPCSPDGACWPKHDTWGWYPTRWRAFPGDVVGMAPTEAEGRQGEQPEETLGGPQPPDATRESQMGPDKPERGGATGAAPGQAPAGAEAPAGQEPPAGEGAAPGAEGAPAAAPLPDLPLGSEDPLSYAPPTPPWLVEQSGPIRLEQPSSVDAGQGTDFEQTAEIEQASVTTPIPAAPNSQQDDAPPALPPGLQQALGAELAPVAPTVQTSPKAPPVASLVQPASVLPVSRPAPAIDRRVVPASAVSPQGIAVINPAAAIQSDPKADGPQQAIYFEASDWASDQE